MMRAEQQRRASMAAKTVSQTVRPDHGNGPWTRAMNHWHARLSSFARPATAFVSQPEPRSIGSFARGKQLLAGNYMFAGHLVEAADCPIWSVKPPSLAFEHEIHGFAWLGDLAAVGDEAARITAQGWTQIWMERFGRGRGAGWSADLTGRRLIRWINHAVFLMAARTKAQNDAYFRSLAHQTGYLSKRWHTASPGLPRFEALTGLIYAGLSLEGMEHHIAPATQALASDCSTQIDAEGGIPTRNPEELLEVFTLLTWAANALSAANHMTPKGVTLAIERIAPTLRALRHADGGLARFHGGERGLDGRLDHALSISGVPATANTGLSMGFARLSGGRTSVVIDAAPPPAVPVSHNAHASTLAFELTSGRRPVIVNCGSGVSFGEDWRLAGRATPLHSTLGVEGYSSSRLGPKRLIGGYERELLLDAPNDVRLQQSTGPDGATILLTHNGYVPTHGLTHVRRLDLSQDGRVLSGVDTLGALSDEEQEIFEHYLNRVSELGVPFSVRFHLHPTVDATLDMGGRAISLTLRSGEVWVFRAAQSQHLVLDRSVYLEKGRLKPRATKQIVLSGTVLDYAHQINWTLAKAQQTPSNLRDLHQDPHDYE
jgi:uncharacterized heparinase superfamily protein